MENIPSQLYETMWFELKKCLGERADEYVLELTEGIEAAIITDYEEQIKEINDASTN